MAIVTAKAVIGTTDDAAFTRRILAVQFRPGPLAELSEFCCAGEADASPSIKRS